MAARGCHVTKASTLRASAISNPLPGNVWPLRDDLFPFQCSLLFCMPFDKQRNFLVGTRMCVMKHVASYLFISMQ